MRRRLRDLLTQRTALIGERDALLERFGVTRTDVEQLEAEVVFLRAAQDVARLRRRIEETGSAAGGQRRANRRLAAQARRHVEELARIEEEMTSLEGEREALLKNDLEQDEAFWRTVKEEIR